MQFRIGTVTHYYEKTRVAVIALDADLAIGETIIFSRGGKELFNHVVDTMQVEHKKIEKASKGDVVAINTEKPVKEGTDVSKVTPNL